MRTKLATTALEMPLYGISFPLSASSELLTEASKVALLLSASNFFRNKFHTIAVFQDATSLCLEELYQSNFTAAKSSNGLSRLFCFQDKGNGA